MGVGSGDLWMQDVRLITKIWDADYFGGINNFSMIQQESINSFSLITFSNG